MTVLNCAVTLILFCVFRIVNCDKLPLVNFETTIHELENVLCGCDRVSNLNVSRVKVYFYNYASGGQENWAYIDQAADSIFATEFNENQCFNIFVLGYNTNIKDSIADDVKCSFSNIKCNDMNTYGIIIDHSAYTKSLVLGTVELYKKSVKHAKSIGHAVGRFIVELLCVVDIKNLNVIGHSLGAHIAGYAAEVVKHDVVPLPVLYTTDPAGPCFDNCPDEHVRIGQAETVINIHCTDSFGTKLKTGDYDFYSHNGVTQKCCQASSSLMELLHCSHGKCALIALAPSYRDDIYEAKFCSSYAEYRNGSCDDCDTMRVGYTVVPDEASKKGCYYFEPETDLCCE